MINLLPTSARFHASTTTGSVAFESVHEAESCGLSFAHVDSNQSGYWWKENGLNFCPTGYCSTAAPKSSKELSAAKFLRSYRKRKSFIF
ncbi:hypothetical protein E6O75_ATG01968 [Venturia nashicola]|uniref:Uncharacterized protein n=1 Tax=Venturia nashicola TaxID=86259 RepID=A0A4Z1PL67_9PEZI|nr:hypothetical protein E6O75_ATG01968 [Venturia nashicola]